MKRLILFSILLIAFVLRTTSLNIFPYGFTPDEASFGYDAYSILQTGKDQWGNSFPLILKSFGDYKPPLYAYLSMPAVAIFGLSKFSVRITNALLGVGAVYITYLLAGELGKLSKLSKKKTHRLQMISSLLLAVSPWHLPMSRGAFEANLTTFLMPLGILLFLRSFKNNKLLIVSAFIFGLNLFSYHSARLVTPFVVFAIIVIFYNEIKKYKVPVRNTSIAVFSIFLVLALYTLTIGGTERAKDISIFGGAAQASAADRLTALENGVPYPVAKAFHNKYLIIGERFVNNYVQYTSYKFLFKDGPAEATYGMIPGIGVTYWFVLPFLLFTLVYLTKHPKDRSLWLIIFWLLVAPIPAAFTSGKGYAANRAVIMLPALQIFIGYGAVELLSVLRKNLDRKYYKLIKVFIVLVATVSVFSFFEKYFVLSPSKVAESMLFGRLESAKIVNDVFDPNEEVIVSTSLSEPHIYIAFAQRIDPKIYQEYSRTWKFEAYGLGWVDQLPEYRLENYVFKKIQWNTDSVNYSNFIGLPDEFPDGVENKIVIPYPDHDPAVLLVNSNIESYAYLTH